MIGTKILEERKSKFNGNLRVVRSFGLGTYIQSDGLTQSGGVVETFWKQTLKKLKSQNSNLKTCLILGLGGGTVAKLIRKFWPGARIAGVDIDPVMVELGKKYLELDKFGVGIIIKDASLYTKYNIRNTRYDLIIVDLYNGDKFPKIFESEEFLSSARRGLADTGIIIFNRLYFKNNKREVEVFGDKIKKVFSKVEYFRPVTNIMFICSKM